MKRDKNLQRLLLLQVRDGSQSPELANYSEEQAGYNLGLLIEDGHLAGSTLLDNSGRIVGGAATHLTSAGHDLLEGLEAARSNPVTAKPAFQPTAMSISIFISHSSQDEPIAAALADLLRTALRLPASDIRCTSVSGYKLQGGAFTNDQLRQEIRGSKTFIGLVTPNSIASVYVLFELGARWGAGLHLLPVLAAGADSKLLKMPLSGINGLNCADRNDINQIVADVATALNQTVPAAHEYGRQGDFLHTLSDEAAKANTPRSQTAVEHRQFVSDGLSDEAVQLLIEASKGRNGIFFHIMTRGGLSVGTNEKELFKGLDARGMAGWRSAIEQLINAGLALSQGEATSRLTELGYAEAGRLVAASAIDEAPVSEHVADPSEDARNLLKAASQDPRGEIYFGTHMGGTTISTNRQQFLTAGKGRELAHWNAVLDELACARYIEKKSPVSFVVTKAGYEAAESIAGTIETQLAAAIPANQRDICLKCGEPRGRQTRHRPQIPPKRGFIDDYQCEACGERYEREKRI